MKIKVIFGAIFLVSAMHQASAQKQNSSPTESIFIMNGRLSRAHRDTVLIYYESNQGESLYQSRPIASDRFILTDSLNHPVSAWIAFKDQGEMLADSALDARLREFYIEPGRIYLSGDPSHPDSIKLIGSKSQDEFVELNKRTADTRKEMQPIYDRYYKVKDAEQAALIGTQLAPYEDRLKMLNYQFFLTHPRSYVTLHEAISFVPQLGLDSSKLIYGMLPAYMKQSPDGQRLAAAIKKVEAVQPGNLASDFISTDINGNGVSLTECRGSYILLDFWASWNHNSRQNNARLMDVYNKYKAKGFVVISIADNDASPKAWKNAVEKDKLGEWVNVLSGNGTDNDLADKYSVHYMPTQILIDPSGKIIGRYGDSNNVHADVLLDRQLAMIFKQ
ncbi:TlpA disulfide reductase family protein [Mucilaginibacter ginsenosidivorans]|uniref:AhpC/TSA family protein n=1 Tax=Mucilaginibacter ginsenosidivorans TaxID=398053 RepID=A0A5B8V2L1_9SPHI|nr:TlpA disulfide reductase family protein [Mucilaginibacter ginsenosidivorans]QEC65315.1 AhpC/TSA family protein [Mucilaginibacter ginsenosidivorans]